MIVHIVGPRPNNIKASAVLCHAQTMSYVLSTHQHPDLEGCVDLNINATYPKPFDWGVVDWLSSEIKRVGAKIVVVYGDTNTTLAGAIAAGPIPVAHVEAGLRCGDLRMIEERNRVMVDAMSRINFCVQERHAWNVPQKSAETVGDVQYDLFLRDKTPITEGGYTLLTLHRAELVDDPKRLNHVLSVIRKSVSGEIVFPVHPRTSKKLNSSAWKKFDCRSPANHFLFSHLLRNANAVITDSGGVSKEAVWAGKPLAIIRDVSEWGLAVCGANAENFGFTLHQSLASGDGMAGLKIARYLDLFVASHS